MATSQHSVRIEQDTETSWYILQTWTYIYSPDPNYQQKMDFIAQCLLKAWYAPEKYVLLYQDEFTVNLL